MPTKDHLLITIDINQNNCNTNALLKTTVAAALGLLPALAADAYVPLVQGGKQWGYVQYLENPCQNRHAYLNYYRLAFSGSKEIDGVTYLKLIKSSNFHIFDNSFSADHCWAYMREEEGKVYVRYNNQANADYLFYDADNTEDITPEFLLYDFNMREGDVLTIPSNREGVSVSLKCVETGQTETLEGYRKYMKFDIEADDNTREWMAYDMLIEGIGPIGNCELSRPYRKDSHTQDDTSPFPTIDLLYKRDYDSYESVQGAMLYLSPLFEVKGVYDPSVWFWPTQEFLKALSEIPSVKRPDSRIAMENSNGMLSFTSDAEEILEVSVYDLAGNALASYRPCSRAFSAAVADCGKGIAVARVKTQSGCQAFKVMLR